MISIDTETHLITPGNLAPKVVCLSWAKGSESGLITGDYAIARFAYDALKSSETIVGANIAYDFAVLCRLEPALIDIIFDKYERGEVYDVLIAEALNAIANGHLFRDPKRQLPGGMMAPLQRLNPDGTWGKSMERYSLELCVWLALDRKNAKANDEYRLRYAELDGIPVEKWPENARQYPIDDAKNTLEVAEAQRKNYMNLHDMPQGWSHMTHQARAAWCMHLSSVWGLTVDAERVRELSDHVEIDSLTAEKRVIELGFMRSDGKIDSAKIKREVVLAHGGSADRLCADCVGKGKIPSEKTRKLINCKKCSATGLELPPQCPLTPAGGVAKDRDTLDECDVPALEELAELTKINKIRDTYLPFLKSGTATPINVKGNVLLETGRASYEGLVQLIPRKGGVRECFRAREGFYFCSVDYSALELCTLAQVLFDLFGSKSRMAQIIRETGDPGALHTEFAAKMCNVDVAEFKRLYASKDKDADAKRQMAKAANFGFPGMMGAAKLVLAKRKEGLRFCTTAGVSDVCGIEMVMEWNTRPLTSPTCKKCIEVAEGLRKQWLAQWPEIQDYFNRLKTYPGATTYGAKLTEKNSTRTGFIRGGLSLTNLANHAFQHLASVGAKHALWQVSKECYSDRNSALYGSRVSLFIHDEIITEVPVDRAHEAGFRQAQVMVDSMRVFTPDIPIVAEPTLMAHWYKDAKLTLDSNGRMVPWIPK